MSISIYDTVTADTLEVGDQIRVDNDEIVLDFVEDCGSVITVKGYSFTAGDTVTLDLDPDCYVDLWTV